MPGMVKCALAALIALAMTCTLATTAHAADQARPSTTTPAGKRTATPAPASAASTAARNTAPTVHRGTAKASDRLAVRTARTAYRMLRTKMARVRATHGKARSITYLPRIKSLPKRLRAPMLARDLRDRNRDKHLDRPRLTFRTGTRDGAACLRLRTGRITRGVCHKPAITKFRPGLLRAYSLVVHASAWLGGKRNLYGVRPRSVALVEQVFSTELPARWVYSYTDIEGDGLVDNGEVLISDSVTGRCGTIVLPASGLPNAHMIHC